MIRVIKTLLIWLFMLALPLQGFAATMKVACGPVHHASLQPVAAQAMHEHDAAHHHEHDSHHQGGVDHASANNASQADPSVQQGTHTSGYCSACSTCNIGSALLFAGLDWGAVPHTLETLTPLPSPLFSGFIPTGLERPPRHILV